MSRVRFLDGLREKLGAVQPAPLPHAETIRRIMADVCKRYRVTADQLRGRKRHPQIIAAKQEVIRQCRAAGKSYPEIGKVLGKHHTTIMYLEKRP